MDPSPSLLIFLIILSAIFSGSEIAFFSMTDAKIEALIHKKVKGAVLVKKLKSKPDKLLITILIGNNIVNIAASAMATVMATNYFKNYGTGIAVGIMTIIILLFGEITPKGIATRKNEKISLIAAKPLLFLSKILSPLIVFLNYITETLINFFGGPLKENTMTLEEFKTMVTIGREDGTIDEIEHEIITKATKLNEIPLTEIMTPLNQVTGISEQAKLNELLKLSFLNFSGFK